MKNTVFLSMLTKHPIVVHAMKKNFDNAKMVIDAQRCVHLQLCIGDRVIAQKAIPTGKWTVYQCQDGTAEVQIDEDFFFDVCESVGIY